MYKTCWYSVTSSSKGDEKIMFKFDDKGELIQESVTESTVFDSEEIDVNTFEDDE